MPHFDCMEFEFVDESNINPFINKLNDVSKLCYGGHDEPEDLKGITFI